MTRTNTLISVLAASAMTLALCSVAAASEYSSVNATVGPPAQNAAESAAYSSPASILGGEEAVGHGGAVDSLNAITGSAGVTSTPASETTVTTSSDGFDWGDALIGAAFSVGLALTTALMVGLMRRRTRVEPSF